MPSIELDTSKQTSEIEGKITGADTISVRWGDIKYQPDTIVVRYTNPHDAGWQVFSITLSGRRVHRYGGVGCDRIEPQVYVGESNDPFARNAPAWASEWAKKHLPKN